MPEFPSKEILQELIPWLLETRKAGGAPIVSIADLKDRLALDDGAFAQLFRWLFEMKFWRPLGSERLEITDVVEKFDRRFTVHTPNLDFHLLHQFSKEQAVIGLMDWVLHAASVTARDEIPGVSLKILTFGDAGDEGRIVQAVAPLWFVIIEKIRRDPHSIYQIGWRDWEEIFAGAYRAGGYDDVILTPASGDRGRDLIATVNGVESFRILGQIKAYKPNHRVRADEVRAFLHVLEADHNASKGIFVTTSSFAPRLRDEMGIKEYVPHRLILRDKEELLPWLADIAEGKSGGVDVRRVPLRP